MDGSFRGQDRVVVLPADEVARRLVKFGKKQRPMPTVETPSLSPSGMSSGGAFMCRSMQLGEASVVPRLGCVPAGFVCDEEVNSEVSDFSSNLDVSLDWEDWERGGMLDGIIDILGDASQSLHNASLASVSGSSLSSVPFLYRAPTPIEEASPPAGLFSVQVEAEEVASTCSILASRPPAGLLTVQAGVVDVASNPEAPSLNSSAPNGTISIPAQQALVGLLAVQAGTAGVAGASQNPTGLPSPGPLTGETGVGSEAIHSVSASLPLATSQLGVLSGPVTINTATTLENRATSPLAGPITHDAYTQVNMTIPISMRRIAMLISLIMQAHVLADPISIARRVMSWLGVTDPCTHSAWETVYGVALAACHTERLMAEQMLHSVIAAAQMDPSGRMATFVSMTEVVRRTLRPLESQPDDAPEGNLIPIEEAAIVIE